MTVVLLPASGPIDSNALATLGRARVEGLAAGASTDVKVELAAPRELPAGRFRLAANADSEGQIGESSETNNRVVRTQPFDLGAAGADLTVTRLFAPRVVSVGQAMAIIVEVENRGTATAAGFGLELGLAASQSSTASAAGLGVHDVDAGLRPGERRLVGPFTGVVSADLTPAAYFALARADFYDQIAESNETNNVLVSIVPTTVIGIDQDDHPNTTAEARLPQDLLDTSGEPSVGLLAPPGDVDVFRFTAAAGSLLTIESSLPDPGGAADTLLILNGPNGSVLASNDDFGGGKASRIGPMALSAGGEFRLTVRSPNPRDRGLYAVRALVEPGRPDLRIVSISRGAPSAVGQGTTLRTTVVVENAGTATAVAGAVLEVYLSAAAVLSTSSVLVARLDVGEVEPGGQRPFPVEAIVDPARVGLGTWFQIASVDPAHALPDGVPGNNTAAADVAVTVVRAPDDHPDIPGGTASPRDDVTVGGAAAAGTLERGGDADCFRIPVELNREYVVETGAGTLDDTVLTLFGADGATVLAENDDAPGTRLSSVRFRPSFSGIAFARVRAFDPIATGTYAVSAHLAPPVSPRDHGAAADDASPVPIDRVVPGEIAPPGDADWFRIAVRGGTQYRFDVTPYSLRSLNVALFGPDGSTELQTATAPQGGEKASLVFTATLDRALFVRVRAADGTSTGQYIVSYSPTVRPSLAVELHRSGDAIVAGVAARGLQSFLARATLLVRLDAREVEYEGRFSAGPAVAGLDTRVQDTGGGVLVLRAFSASVRAASGTTPSGTLFSLTLRALHPGNVAPPGAATVVFAELVTDRDEAFQFNGCLADAGLDRRIPVALAGQQLLPTIPDPLLAPPDNRRAYVRLDGRLSTDPNLVPEPLSYRWSLLDGPGPVTLSDPASAVPTFAPSVSGSYAFALQVSNGSLQSAPSRVTVRIERPDVAPTAAPRAIEVASGRSTGPATPTLVVQAAVPEIELDGTRSFDPNAGDRNRLTYAWRQIAGPSAALTPTATAPAPHFAAAVPGRYDFELVVSDPGGNVSAAEPVSVLAVPPGDRLPALALLATA
ncbi:MAG: hypothetical protein HY303_21970 [Candidatus Wallbacteria bacterium]|nr:hypothetical protein [Candidatus Wallbacteria bacterium]